MAGVFFRCCGGHGSSITMGRLERHLARFLDGGVEQAILMWPAKLAQHWLAAVARDG